MINLIITLLLSLAVSHCLPTGSIYPNITDYNLIIVEDEVKFQDLITNPRLYNDRPNQIFYLQATDEYCTNNKTFDKQYCTKVLSKPDTWIDHIGAPLTACLDSRFGEGGSTSKSLSVSVGMSTGYTVGLGYSAITAVTLSGSSGVSTSVSFSMSVSCDVTTGNIVQMWGFPFFTTASISYRSFEVGKFGRMKNKSKWSDPEMVTFPSTIGPATKCVGSVNEKVCGAHTVKNSFIAPGEPLVDKVS